MSDKKYCVIGDLHGRIDTLNAIIERSAGYHYILLGDTIHHKPFFKRTKRTSPIRMLKKVKDLTDSGIATTILGNHENYILENLILPKSKIKQKELRYTLQCFKELSLQDRLNLINWLNNLPKSMEVESCNRTYRIAHAYYPPTTDFDRNKVLIGLGYQWFKQDDLSLHIDPNSQYLLGHYGSPYFRKNLKIIDATNFEGVGVYYTDREEFLIYY